jgi:nitrate/nitrite transporter NarK
MCAVQAAIWLIPSDELDGREAAVGLAAIGSIGMLGSFTGPFAWGLAKDYTGDYRAGLFGVAAAYLTAAGILLYIRNLHRTARPDTLPAPAPARCGRADGAAHRGGASVSPDAAAPPGAVP